MRTLPERLDAFMARANAAYYATKDPFRDFTTAPEISQIFGELLGAWAATVWQQIGSPTKFVFAEAGPGRGTLMRDACRATSRVAPEFYAAACINFIETSPRLRAIQREAVPNVVWHNDLSDLPHGKLILLANEFLDALPIRQFVRVGGTWQERHVHEGVFVLRPADAPLPATAAPEGVVQEQGDAACTWTKTLAARLTAQGGAALILDYGPARSGPGDSLQALRDGRPTDPLIDPGKADLTAHVDFQALGDVACAAGAAVWGPLPQGDFLARLGLFQRAASLASSNPARAAATHDAADRLAAPSRMGQLFKALAITHPAAPPPPGFAT
jgi:NADH dehydrogenase [ubiquinone] 1 alpha subcomplex assembly factor 7